MSHRNRFALTASVVALLTAPAIAYAAPVEWRGPIPAVVQATAEQGWPHFPTVREQEAVVGLVIRSEMARYRSTRGARPARGMVACTFGYSIARSVCGVVIKPPRAKASRYRVDVLVRRDGKYRVVRA